MTTLIRQKPCGTIRSPATLPPASGSSEARAQLQAYVERCLREARQAPDPARFRALRTAKPSEFLQMLSAAAERDLDPPPHLVGLTAFDLTGAIGLLKAAADGGQA